MQCSCGASTVQKTAIDKAHVLEYQQCPACGRIGGELLFDGGQVVSRGTSARNQFNQKAGETA